MNTARTRYSVIRRPVDDASNADTIRLGRFARGSVSPPAELPGSVRQQRVGEHDLQVQRDGGVVMIALPGALRLRGRPDQIRGLAEALLAALDG